MNAIDKYQQTVQDCRNFERWKSLIGKEYFGGTCGKGGEYGSIRNSRFSCEIYHQEYDGASNYHGSDRLGKLAESALQESANKHATVIIATALDIMHNHLAKDATAAKLLSEKIVADAGKGDV